MDYMKIALDEARKALNKGEVPVGAVIVKEGNIIAAAHNLHNAHQCFSEKSDCIPLFPHLGIED